MYWGKKSWEIVAEEAYSKSIRSAFLISTVSLIMSSEAIVKLYNDAKNDLDRISNERRVNGFINRGVRSIEADLSPYSAHSKSSPAVNAGPYSNYETPQVIVGLFHPLIIWWDVSDYSDCRCSFRLIQHHHKYIEGSEQMLPQTLQPFPPRLQHIQSDLHMGPQQLWVLLLWNQTEQVHLLIIQRKSRNRNCVWWVSR